MRAVLISAILLLGASAAIAANAVAAPPVAAPVVPQRPDLEFPQYLPLVASYRNGAGLMPVDLKKGPDVLYAGDNTQMKIVWQLDRTTGAQVQWGTDVNYTGGSASTNEYTGDHMHAYTVTSLTPGWKYYYRVISGTGYSAGSFTAAPASSATSVKFIAYGDTRSNPDTHNGVANRMISTYTADPAYQTFALHVGDLVSTGDVESAWSNEFFSTEYPNIRAVLANVSLLPVMGNHEDSGVLFRKYFPMPFVSDRYWSFDYGPAHVVMMDQYTSWTTGSAQYNWLRDDLANSNKLWKFIVLHAPGWSAGGHTNNTNVQDRIQPLAVQYGVSFIIAGHNHYYARAVVNGVQHLTVGTGGAPIDTPDPTFPNVVTTDRGYGFTKFAINGNTLTMTVVRSDGSVVETLTLTR